jgi:iron-sulfur cluster assembly protein
MAITLTERAAQHLRKHLLQDTALAIRVGVRRAGCSGFTYDLQVEQIITPNDTVSESCGIRIVVDEGSLKYVDGTQIDYATKGLNHVFQFANPNVRAACGCGESFTV